MEVRQYIGARYVPKFVGLWNNTTQYNALEVVDNGAGTSYISRKTVPAGTALAVKEYWAVYGASSGAILDLQSRMGEAENDITAIQSSILNIGGQVATNTANIGTLTGKVAVMKPHVADRVIVVDEATTTSAINALLTSPSWIILQATVTVTDDDTFNDNLIGVIGAGGMFSGSNNDVIYFPTACIFINDNRQIFSSQLMVKGTGNTMLVGRARPQWWGYYPGSATSYGAEFVYATGSFFDEFAFSSGIWHCYPNMTVSHRRVIMEAGAIIDGIIHAGVSSCTDVHYVGRIYSTVRVGFTGACSHIQIPDGISILGLNASYYNQQNENGCKGVHISGGSSFIDIGDIDIAYTSTRSDSAPSYGLCIDESSSRVHIGRYRSLHNNGRTDGNGFDIYCNTASFIQIDDIEISAVEKGIHSCIKLTGVTSSRFGTIRIIAGSTAAACIMIDGNSYDISFVGTVRVYTESASASFYDIFLNGVDAHDIYFADLICNGGAQGLRIVSSLRITITAILIMNNSGTAIVSTGTYFIAKNWSA